MFVEHKALPCISLLLTTIILPNRLQSYLHLKYSTSINSPQFSSYFWKIGHASLSRRKHSFDLSDTIRISMRNRSIRCKYHAYNNKCIRANNGKQITWFRLTINCIGWWSEICVDQTTFTFFAPSAVFGNWYIYPVSLLTAAPRGTQEKITDSQFWIF